ncbi:uncharacterized protein LOC6529432 [Drosophila yakuba]|uniref:Uncharacterized protein n=1 Tax=Drosophila yakuba TaxID=7245 RepID=B4P8P0_DROYA|nr:uncharacterized protein LOC6529432 [Drosophila yakuba]EDW90148.1 uncharacterized protein Dyak_GE12803 [Drosophila yakuba]
MPCIFNPGYIGPDPPCCDPDCLEEGHCTVPECGVCPESQLPRCNPAPQPNKDTARQPLEQKAEKKPKPQEQQ